MWSRIFAFLAILAVSASHGVKSKSAKSRGIAQLAAGEHSIDRVLHKNGDLKHARAAVSGKTDPAPPAPESTIVGAQLRCQGFMCPQWALDVSRWDLDAANNDAYPEYQLAELLPLAPTWQRMPTIFTDYDQSTRLFTVAVQSYPGPGVDSFFSLTIADDISSAKMVQNNVIVAHPDATSNNPGSMTLIRAFDSPDPNGGVVCIFNDGSIYNLDLVSKAYTLLGSLKGDASVKGAFVTNAHVFDGMVLKSFLVAQNEKQSWLVTFDLSTNTATAPVALLPVENVNNNGAELPVNAHMRDNGLGTNVLVVVMAGNFDQLIQVDESKGTQTPLIFNMYSGSGTDDKYPALLYCDDGTKDCDTVWTTSAYDPVSKNMYIQAHFVDESTETYYTMIYKQYNLNQVAGTFAYMEPVCYMNFGYSGYQFVALGSSATKRAAIKAPPKKSATASKEQQRKPIGAHHSHVPADVREAATRKLQNKSPAGTIISAQYWKAAQSESHELRITATYPVTLVNTPNDVLLQTLVPDVTQDNQVFTAFDSASRTFYVVVDNFPTANKMTAWASTISAKADAATPVYTAVTMTYPDSSSPAPLNVLTPAIARVLFSDSVGGLTVIFQNGEVHSVDLAAKTFTKQLMLITPEDLYSVAHPFATGAQVVDAGNGVLQSFIFSASNTLLSTVDLATKKVLTTVGPLDMPGTQDATTGFSPESLIHAQIVNLGASADAGEEQTGLLLQMESLPTTGFDELNFVNTTSGAFVGPVYNLAEDNLFLECFSYNCDKWRTMAYDEADQTVYFQAHLEIGNSPAQVVLAAMVYVKSLSGGRSYWIVNPTVENLSFGYTGMVWVPFV